MTNYFLPILLLIFFIGFEPVTDFSFISVCRNLCNPIRTNFTYAYRRKISRWHDESIFFLFYWADSQTDILIIYYLFVCTIDPEKDSELFQ